MPYSPFERNLELRRKLFEQLGSSELIPSLKSKNDFCKLEEWLFSTPKYTTLRVSTHLLSPEAAKSKMKLLLKELYSSKANIIPKIYLHPQVPDLLIMECFSSSNGVQPCPKEVIVDVICGSAVLRGANIFAPGVMAVSFSVQVGDKVTVYADLDNHCLKGWMKHYNGRKLLLGNGIAKLSRQDIFSMPMKKGIAVEMIESVGNHPSLSDEVLGSDLYLQNLPSIICSHVLNPASGDWVLDMCAAPGGKTVNLGIIMKDQGYVIALDKRKKKIKNIQQNAERFHLSCIHSYAFDSTKSLDSSKTVEHTINIRNCGIVPAPPFPCLLFDCILLDAPCSSLGQRPQLSNSMTIRELSSYPLLQKKLFKTAVGLLKYGGTLVYSTCTLTLDENEGVVKWALESFPSLQLVSQDPHVGGTGLPIAGLDDKQLSMLQRFQPKFYDQSSEISDNHNIDTIGFFIAKFLKTEH